MTGLQECRSVSGVDALNHALRNDALWTAAAFDYELGYALEPASGANGGAIDAAGPRARLWRFDTCRELDATALEAWLSAQLSALDSEALLAGVGGIGAEQQQGDYLHGVERIRHWIAAGDCYQVNFTFPLHFCHFGSPLALYAKLREQQPVAYGGVLIEPDGAIVSLSPELFLERRGRRVITRPMKGTAPRAEDPEQLRLSAKNRAENLMIVDLLRNDLGRVADTGSVQVEALFAIEEYPTVWQMVSQVSATVAPTVSTGEMLAALFPCGSVTGAPKIRAMQIINELEQSPRGLYTGAFGWLAPDGDFRLNVAIRTLELARDGSGRMGVGSGIVADSDAADEWQECWLKAAFLKRIDPGLKLIETLRCEQGEVPLLPWHLRRISTSAAWLGFAYDPDKIRQAFADVPLEGVWRLRLTLDKPGAIELAIHPLDSLPPECRAEIARESIDSRHPLRRHKTTARAQYDRALAELTEKPEVFDRVFVNERGEVAEGARSNVFVERDGVLLTPPLASGALPGVLRAKLLAEGRAREATLFLRDLEDGFLLGNALRGLVPVRLISGR